MYWLYAEKTVSLNQQNFLQFKEIFFIWAYIKETEKKYLIESKKLFVWNTFFDVKKCFVLMKHNFWFKQNIFGSNKYLLESNKFLP